MRTVLKQVPSTTKVILKVIGWTVFMSFSVAAILGNKGGADVPWRGFELVGAAIGLVLGIMFSLDLDG